MLACFALLCPDQTTRLTDRPDCQSVTTTGRRPDLLVLSHSLSLSLSPLPPPTSNRQHRARDHLAQASTPSAGLYSPLDRAQDTVDHHRHLQQQQHHCHCQHAAHLGRSPHTQTTHYCPNLVLFKTTTTPPKLDHSDFLYTHTHTLAHNSSPSPPSHQHSQVVLANNGAPPDPITTVPAAVTLRPPSRTHARRLPHKPPPIHPSADRRHALNTSTHSQDIMRYNR